MADPGKPPLPPYFPDVRYRTYPEHIQKLSDAAFKAEYLGKRKEAEKKHKELNDALTEQAKMGISNSGLNARTEKRPLVRGNWYGGKTRRNKSSGGDIVTHLLTIRNQVKLYHWQTGSFARHKATDDLTAALDLSIDTFVEVYMGKYSRPTVKGSIKLHNFSESAARSFVAKETAYLQKELPRKIGKNDTDLLNIRDEILAELNKVLYLFTLS